MHKKHLFPIRNGVAATEEVPVFPLFSMADKVFIFYRRNHMYLPVIGCIRRIYFVSTMKHYL